MILGRVGSFVLGLVLVSPYASPLVAQSGLYRDRVFPVVEVRSDLVYGAAVSVVSGGLEMLLLDLYQPASDVSDVRPAIVLAHEGGFLTGDKRQGAFVRLAEDFASRGYVAVSINYRLGVVPVTPEDRDAASEDVLAAVRWLRSQKDVLRIDIDRIACLGASAGAVASMTGQYDDSLGEGQSGNPGFRSDAQAVVDLWGALEDVTDLDRDEAPLAIFHGTKDLCVPFQFAVDLSIAAAFVGLPAELQPIPGAPHAPWATYFEDFHPQTVAFLYEQMRLAELGGLAVRSTSGPAGPVVIDTYGQAGDMVVLLAGTSREFLPIPELGTLLIGPVEALVTSGIVSLPTMPRVARAEFVIGLPEVALDQRLRWQAVQVSADGRGLLTNDVEVRLGQPVR